MRSIYLMVLCGLIVLSHTEARAQTADDVKQWIDRLVELDSIDIAKDVKYRAGLEPPLHALDADESSMTVLTNPYEVQGRNQPAAAGWYRVSFTVPDTIGKFAVPTGGYNLGIESNVLGSWEIYTYVNGKSVGSAMAAGVPGTAQYGTALANSRQNATAWMSNAPLPTKPGDKYTVAILAMSSPLGRGSAEGYALRFLRLRFALAHTFSRQPFYGSVTAPGMGSGLHGAREMLSTAKGDDLIAVQERLKGPLSRLDALLTAADTGRLDELTKAMKVAVPEINQALRKPQ